MSDGSTAGPRLERGGPACAVMRTSAPLPQRPDLARWGVRGPLPSAAARGRPRPAAALSRQSRASAPAGTAPSSRPTLSRLSRLPRLARAAGSPRRPGLRDTRRSPKLGCCRGLEDRRPPTARPAPRSATPPRGAATNRKSGVSGGGVSTGGEKAVGRQRSRLVVFCPMRGELVGGWRAAAAGRDCWRLRPGPARPLSGGSRGPRRFPARCSGRSGSLERAASPGRSSACISGLHSGPALWS